MTLWLWNFPPQGQDLTGSQTMVILNFGGVVPELNFVTLEHSLYSPLPSINQDVPGKNGWGLDAGSHVLVPCSLWFKGTVVSLLLLVVRNSPHRWPKGGLLWVLSGLAPTDLLVSTSQGVLGSSCGTKGTCVSGVWEPGAVQQTVAETYLPVQCAPRPVGLWAQTPGLE